MDNKKTENNFCRIILLFREKQYNNEKDDTLPPFDVFTCDYD